MSVIPKNARVAITIAALGYFVDIYDLILFGVIRKDSLLSLGVPESDLMIVGQRLLNDQMLGLLIGGILWGIIGDKKGRLSVLFGSILMYSVANIANGMVTSVEMYALWRFIAGIGLAGELGAGITLVSELLPKESRGYGTTIVASFGLLGAVVAGLVGGYQWNLGYENWRVAFFIGGIMGLLLLLLRVSVYESGMFQMAKNAEVQKGNFFQLFNQKKRFLKYLYCILIGVPIWYAIGILVFFSPEFGKFMKIDGIVAGTSIMLAYLGLSVGDICCGILSQKLYSRKKAVGVFLSLTLIFSLAFLLAPFNNLTWFYSICFCIGFGSGYWAVFVTIAAEQFGTNIRATVTTTVPNFVRGSLVLVEIFFSFIKGYTNLMQAALITGLIVIVMAAIALNQMEETIHKDLDYLEEN